MKKLLIIFVALASVASAQEMPPTATVEDIKNWTLAGMGLQLTVDVTSLIFLSLRAAQSKGASWLS